VILQKYKTDLVFIILGPFLQIMNINKTILFLSPTIVDLLSFSTQS